MLSSCKEPVWYRQCLFSNENASLYILNFSDKELETNFYTENGNIKEVKLKPKKWEIINKDGAYAESLDESSDDFVYLSFDNIKNGRQAMDWYSFPFEISDEDRYCSDLINEKIQKIEIKKSDDSIIYKSNLSLQNVKSTVVFQDSALLNESPYQIQNNFTKGNFLFESRPGDFLFVDCDVDFSEKINGYYGTVKNPRYIIIIK